MVDRQLWGAERVFGWGTAATGDDYAEVLTEVLCDQLGDWPLAAPRRLDPGAPLAGAVAVRTRRRTVARPARASATGSWQSMGSTDCFGFARPPNWVVARTCKPSTRSQASTNAIGRYRSPCPQARKALAAFATTAGVTEDQLEGIRLVVSEAVSNAVLHAYDGDAGEIQVTAAVVPGELWILIADDGFGLRAERSGNRGARPWPRVDGPVQRWADAGDRAPREASRCACASTCSSPAGEANASGARVASFF